MGGMYRMADDGGLISGVAGSNIWSTILTAGLGVMAYLAKKFNDGITSNAKAIASLELKIAENYSTKQTVLALFQEATTQTKESVARVEKSIDATNGSVRNLDLKIDKVADSINRMQTNVMSELSKKT